MFGQQVLLTNENPASLGKQSHETWLEQNRPRFLWCTGFNRSLKLKNSCCAPSPVPWCQAAPHRGAHRRDWAGPSLSVCCSVMQGASQFKVMGFVLSTFLLSLYIISFKLHQKRRLDTNSQFSTMQSAMISDNLKISS